MQHDNIIPFDGWEILMSNYFSYMGFIIQKDWEMIVMSTIKYKIDGRDEEVKWEFYMTHEGDCFHPSKQQHMKKLPPWKRTNKGKFEFILQALTNLLWRD